MFAANPQKGLQMRIRQVNTDDLTEFAAFVAHIIGRKWVEASTFDDIRDYPDVLKKKERKVKEQVRRMSAEKLGWICAHSTYYGIHNSNVGQRPRFINRIGLMDMSDRNVEGVMPDDRTNRPFREVMETTATLSYLLAVSLSSSPTHLCVVD
jgi:hypothetical protein